MSDDPASPNGHGCIAVVTSDSRARAYIRVAKIAGVLAIGPEGPTRIMFDAGGHIDICGGFEVWRRIIRIVELGGEQP